MNIVDSYRLSDGRVVALRLHEQRFKAHALWAGTQEADVTAFLEEVRASLPREGEWFPKVSYGPTGFHLEIRECPPLRNGTVLAVSEGALPTYPEIKGPDMPMLGRRRAASEKAGAHDALLVSRGYATEAANAALLMFTPNGVAMAPEGEVLGSVTAAATFGRSCRHSLLGPVERRPLPVEEVLRNPAWVGSSLHGWTPVTEWVLETGEKVQAVNMEKPTARSINDELWRRAESLDGRLV